MDANRVAQQLRREAEIPEARWECLQQDAATHQSSRVCCKWDNIDF